MTNDSTQDEIDRLLDLRRRAIDGGLDEARGDRELIRQLDQKLARLYGKRVTQGQRL